MDNERRPHFGRDFADSVMAARLGQAPDPAALDFPRIADGAHTIKLIEAATASNERSGAWGGRFARSAAHRNDPTECHPRESGGPGPVTDRLPWMPAFAGMTTMGNLGEDLLDLM
jgi:hypothetical protein